jgi:phage portal protein BeeE
MLRDDEAKHAAAREIALALGVPPSMRSIAPR